MTDDTERRLHEALGGANLPAAPDTLRDALHAVADSPAPVPPRRTWLRTLPALAAVAVLAIVASAMTGGFGRFGDAASGSPSAMASAAPTAIATGTPLPSPTQPPRPAAPPTAVDVMDAERLRDEIGLVKAGGQIPHDVVVDVGATPRQRNTFVATPCGDGTGTCTLVGQLDGFDEATGSIVIRAQDRVQPPPADAASLAAPLALHIAADGSLELLGHVDLTVGTGRLDMNGLRAATATATPGHVVAVLGWLGKALSASCGPYLPDDVPNPFQCPGITSFLNDEPVNAVEGDATGGSGHLPATAVRVGAWTYDQFAPSPFTDQWNGVPRQGLYLIRMVAVDNADCAQCRGWLLVGRLDLRSDATAGNSPSFNGGVKTYTPDEIEAMLTADRAAWIDKAVIVEGSVSQVDRLKCEVASAGCVVGKLVGTSEWVEASTYTSQLAGGITGGTMAMRVRDDGLEFLGLMGGGDNGVDNRASVGWLGGSAWSGDNALTTLIVKGWLVAAPAHPCPLMPGAAPPQDTPFSTCPGAWLTPTEEQPTTLVTNGMTVDPPKDAVMVQYGAYSEFAPNPDSTNGVPQPREGTYLVRLVVDTRTQGPNAPAGWQVIARLDAPPG